MTLRVAWLVGRGALQYAPTLHPRAPTNQHTPACWVALVSDAPQANICQLRQAIREPPTAGLECVRVKLCGEASRQEEHLDIADQEAVACKRPSYPRMSA